MRSCRRASAGPEVSAYVSVELLQPGCQRISNCRMAGHGSERGGTDCPGPYLVSSHADPPRPNRTERHAAFLRSKLRYWMASLTWMVESSSAPARSAMVRPILRIRWYARAERPSRATASRSRRSTGSDSGQ